MRSLSPPSVAPPFARYAHGVEVPAGHRIVRTSGQLGLATDGTTPKSAEDQAEICFATIRAVLAEAGMGPGDVFHVSAYVTGREHMQAYMAARDRFLADAGPELPSSTLLIVSGFTRPEFLVEVEVWAAAP
ncbi:RidA family protein [Chachezhania antarctica]|uniref:RidA family protein n=1 Tax=Chachezhania antarctica TaxID=2340860 RepID=UPI000EB1F58F|nr:RidA family protein [Chachezhania antarctica]